MDIPTRPNKFPRNIVRAGYKGHQLQERETRSSRKPNFCEENNTRKLYGARALMHPNFVYTLVAWPALYPPRAHPLHPPPLKNMHKDWFFRGLQIAWFQL